MPMDRLNHAMAGCGLMLVLAAAGGCKSTRSEVPPGRPYTNDGKQVPPIGFSSEPHAMTGPGIVGGSGAPGAPQFGTPGSASSANLGAPTGNQFGPPGTSMGSAQTPSGAGFSSGAAESSSMPSPGLGAPSGGSAPSPGAMPGTTGQPGQ
jgi:hypothetical protein